MSLLVDTSPLIASAHVVRELAGLGVRGDAIPSSGDDGPSYLYDDADLPTDDAKEFRGLVTAAPASGQFFAYDDGSFTLIGASDGTYTFEYDLYVDGVFIDSVVETIEIGEAGPGGGTAPGATMTCAWTVSAGAATGVRNVTVAGANVVMAWTLQRGAAYGPGGQGRPTKIGIGVSIRI